MSASLALGLPSIAAPFEAPFNLFGYTQVIVRCLPLIPVKNLAMQRISATALTYQRL